VIWNKSNKTVGKQFMFFFLIDFNSTTQYVLHKNKQQYEVKVTPYKQTINPVFNFNCFLRGITLLAVRSIKEIRAVNSFCFKPLNFLN